MGRPPKKLGGEEVNEINSAAPITCDTSSEHESRDKTTTDMLEKVKVPNIVQMEKETNQDKTRSLPRNKLMGNGFSHPYQRENKKKDQPTTSAGQEDAVTTSARQDRLYS